MPLYEGNYRKLAELVPDLSGVEQAIILGKREKITVHLQVTERFKYTSTLTLTCHAIDAHRHVSNPCLKIRLYHDAKVAEVLSFQGHSRIEAIYPYPNPQMYHRDEKRQVNRFLGELLNYCLFKGYLVSIEQARTAV